MIWISTKTESCSGADLENITNEASYLTISEKRKFISDDDLLNAFRKVMNEKYTNFIF